MIDHAPDLYAALRDSGAAPEALPAIIASADPATRARLCAVDQGFLRAILGHAQGIRRAPAVQAALAGITPAPMFAPDLAAARTIMLPCDGSVPGMPAFSDRAFDAWFSGQGIDYGLGLYDEPRAVYQTPQFADAASPERRTIHLGIDVFAKAGTPVMAPLPGRVRYVTYQADPLDYGHTLIVQHDIGGVLFHSLYGHLGASLPGLLAPGDRVVPGQTIAHLGDWTENGGWAPHLHFQIMTDMLDQTDGNFFGVGHASLRDIWCDILIDPNLVLRLPPDRLRPRA